MLYQMFAFTKFNPTSNINLYRKIIIKRWCLLCFKHVFFFIFRFLLFICYFFADLYLFFFLFMKFNFTFFIFSTSKTHLLLCIQANWILNFKTISFLFAIWMMVMLSLPSIYKQILNFKLFICNFHSIRRIWNRNFWKTKLASEM